MAGWSRTGSSGVIGCSAAAAAGLCGSGAVLAPVSETGEEGAAEDEEGEDGEALWAEAGVDQGSHQKAAESAAPAHHPERVGQDGEEGRDDRGCENLGEQAAPLRSLEACEEAPGVALALFGDGVEEGWLYHAGFDSGFGEALDALIEE